MDHEASTDRENGYEQYFGFHRTPFSLAADTRFRFDSASHAAALAQISYALERREPAVVVTGEIGTGKTLLCRTVVEQLRRKTFLSIINDPLLGHDDLLKQMLQDFGVLSRDRARQTATTRHDLVETLHAFLSSLAPLHAHAVVIIDEAQHLNPDVLEHIRLVSNFQDEHGTMLQIILVGQTELDQLLSRPELRPLKQRVSRSVRLEPLSGAEVAHYIGHRLSVARKRTALSNMPGAAELESELAEWDPDNTFTPEAIREVARLSRGIPRVVNLLCDRALEAAYAAERQTVDATLISQAAVALALPAAAEASSFPAFASPGPIAWPQLVPTAVPMFGATSHGVRSSRYVIAGVVLVLVGAGVWFGGRALNREGNAAPVSATPAATPPARTPEPAPPAATQPILQPPSAAAIPPPSGPQATGTTATSAESAGETFEIVVASFHTAARATEVAASIAALGQPVRQRTAGEWQQVLAGPYSSTAEAREAQQRLERAGFTGTHLVPVAR